MLVKFFLRCLSVARSCNMDCRLTWCLSFVISVNTLAPFYCDRKARASSAQSFTLWQKAAQPLMCMPHFSYIAALEDLISFLRSWCRNKKLPTLTFQWCFLWCLSFSCKILCVLPTNKKWGVKASPGFPRWKIQRARQGPHLFVQLERMCREEKLVGETKRKKETKKAFLAVSA